MFRLVYFEYLFEFLISEVCFSFMIDRKGYFCFGFTRKLIWAYRELISDRILIFDLEVKCSFPTKNKRVIQTIRVPQVGKYSSKWLTLKKLIKVHQQYIHCLSLYSVSFLKVTKNEYKIVFFRSWKTNITIIMRPWGRCHDENTFKNVYMITIRKCSFWFWRLK